MCLFASACADAPVGPDPAGQLVPFRLTAQVGDLVRGVSVEISAPDIDPPSVQNIPVVDGVASGSIEVTAGTDRVFTVRALDARGVVTHRGADTLDIVAGANPALTLTLEPVSGDVPITVELAAYVVAIDPDSAVVAVGASLGLSATVADGGGDPVADPQIVWGSTDPGVAYVDPSGVVVGVASGTATIVANYRGSVALAEITVEE
ncbi:MAG: Ig-like domain-containing protein [Gemmatimonadota bacterium]